jgi:hypothetical protein
VTCEFFLALQNSSLRHYFFIFFMHAQRTTCPHVFLICKISICITQISLFLPRVSFPFCKISNIMYQNHISTKLMKPVCCAMRGAQRLATQLASGAGGSRPRSCSATISVAAGSSNRSICGKTQLMH